MDRRAFLKTALPAAALAAGLPGCRGGDDGGTGGVGSNPPGQDAKSYPQLHFVTQDLAFSDYRPAIDALGQQVIFERTPTSGANALTTLSLIASLASPSPVPFLTAANNPGKLLPPSQTRPDWCWRTGRVALNGAPDNKAPVSVYITNGDGSGLTPVPGSLGWFYPIWSRDGTLLVVYNDKNTAVPQPSTSLIMSDGTVVTYNLNGYDVNGTSVFGGFAAPNPGNPYLIAYAGQPDLPNWGPGSTTECPSDASGYNQCYNYPFLNALTGAGMTSAPLEPSTSLTAFDSTKQGRAPYWSPDGKYLLFESDRLGGYAIFLANIAAGTAPVAVTDPAYGAQHAKFFPTGDRLILTALQAPSTAGPRGIAWVDISKYL